MPSLDTILTNAAALVPYLLDLISASTLTSGTWMFIVFLLRIRTHSKRPHEVKWTGTLARLFSSALLLSFAYFSSATATQLFGSDTSTLSFSGIAYAPSGASGSTTQMNAAIGAVLQFVRVIGYAFLAWAIHLLVEIGDGNAGVRKTAPIWHGIGGALCVNNVALLEAAQQTFGFQLIN